DGAGGQGRDTGEDAAAGFAGGGHVDGAVGQIHCGSVDAAAVYGDVTPDRAAAAVEEPPAAPAVIWGGDAGAARSGVAVDKPADHGHIPRPRLRGAGDGTPIPGGPVPGDGAVLGHQVGVAHADAAPAAGVAETVANRQALKSDLDRMRGSAEYVEHPVEPLAVTHGDARSGPLEDGAAGDVEITCGVGVVGAGEADLVDAGF